jgi:hypothetical protein
MWTGVVTRRMVRKDRRLVRVVGDPVEMRNVLDEAMAQFGAVGGALRRADWFEQPARAGLASRLRSRADRAQDADLSKKLSVAAERWEEITSDAPPKMSIGRRVFTPSEAAANDEGRRQGRQESVAKSGLEAVQDALARLNALERFS